MYNAKSLLKEDGKSFNEAAVNDYIKINGSIDAPNDDFMAAQITTTPLSITVSSQGS